MMTGTTIYNATDNRSVCQGTVIAENPSSSPTSGAKANTMVRSFGATWSIPLQNGLHLLDLGLLRLDDATA